MSTFTILENERKQKNREKLRENKMRTFWALSKVEIINGKGGAPPKPSVSWDPWYVSNSNICIPVSKLFIWVMFAVFHNL